MAEEIKRPKVTVIIPIYRTESTIERCAISLFEQTLKEIEYIFINDCTPDKSMQILEHVIEKYPQRKQQTTIINLNNNQGIATIRQIGIKRSSGVFIIHCDSDDYIDNNAYEEMYNFAMSNNCDMVFSDNYIHTNGSTSYYIGVNSTQKKQLIQDYLLANKSAHLWSILVNKMIAHNEMVVYPQGQMMEDLCLIIQYVMIATKTGYLHNSYYHHFRHSNSLSYISNDLEQVQRQCKESEINLNIVKDFMLKMNYNNFEHELVYGMYLMKNNLLPFLTDSKSCNIWINSFHDINIKLFLNPYISTLSKLKGLSILFHIYPIINKLRKL